MLYTAVVASGMSNMCDGGQLELSTMWVVWSIGMGFLWILHGGMRLSLYSVCFLSHIQLALILITAAQLTGCATSAGPFLLIYGMNMALVGIVNVTHLTY